MQFDFLSSNLQIAYPFRERREGVSDIIAAAQICTPTPLPVSLRRLSTSSVELGIGGDLLSMPHTAVDYGSWRVYTAAFSGRAIILVVWKDAAPGATIDLTADPLEFEPSTVVVPAAKLRKVSLKIGGELIDVASAGDTLKIAPGYNMRMLRGPQVDGARPAERIQLDAVPGEGVGRYLLCPDADRVITLNGVAADETGNVSLDAKDCYWVEGTLADEPIDNPGSAVLDKDGTSTPHKLRVRNACGPCCSCTDYVNTYRYLNVLWRRAKNASELYKQALDLYTQVLVEYELRVAKFEPGVTLRSFNDGQAILMIVRLRNSALDPIEGITLAPTLAAPEGVSVSYSQGSGFVRYPAGNVQLDLTEGSVELPLPMPPMSDAFWVSVWALSGIEKGDAVAGTVEVTGAIEETYSAVVEV